MAYTQFAFGYTSGREANLAVLIFSQDQQSIYVSGSAMSAISGVADSAFATGRRTATEIRTSTGTGIGRYKCSAFPSGLPAAFYLMAPYDVATPSNLSPGPTSAALSLNSSGLVYWDGSTLIDGVQTVLFSPGALDQFAGVATPGAGADTCTMTITDLGDPVANARVWITTDAEGDDVVAGTKDTNDDGQATFLLNAGLTYWLWMQKSGENSINGQSFVAVAD
jgi:hypothetical protein